MTPPPPPPPPSLIQRTRIKICGITSLEDAMIAVDAGADAIGFVFVEKTPRWIDPDRALGILEALPPMVTAVGVFRDPSLEWFMDVVEACPTRAVQVHGRKLTPQLAAAMSPGLIRALQFEADTIGDELEEWSATDGVEMVLVDGSAGGEGTAFDWAALAAAKDRCSVPMVVAGGLTPDSVGEAVRTVRPFAVDVSSGVEASPGKKDHDAVRALCTAVRTADAAEGNGL